MDLTASVRGMHLLWARLGGGDVDILGSAWLSMDRQCSSGEHSSPQALVVLEWSWWIRGGGSRCGERAGSGIGPLNRLTVRVSDQSTSSDGSWLLVTA